MRHSPQQLAAPLPAQVEFWNRWNAQEREHGIGKVSAERADAVLGWVRRLGRSDLELIDIGCGAGWLCGKLQPFGHVTGTDLSDVVLQRARLRAPDVAFIAGDCMTLDLPQDHYDVAVSLEVLSHVASPSAFLARTASLLRPDGLLMLATQNRPQLERNDIPPPLPGQIRKWVDRHELAALLSEHFVVEELFSITPVFNAGWRRYANAAPLHRLLTQAGLGPLSRWFKSQQERAWLGWTLMALARKR